MALILLYVHKFYYYAQQALSPLRRYKCACAIKFHVPQLMNTLMKMASTSRSNLCSC